MPTLILRGEHAPRPSRLIAAGLARVMRTARLRIVPNAGHMGPFTHADDVNTAIAEHLELLQLQMSAPRANSFRPQIR